MPSLFKIHSYVVYFWSNENGKPVHVHINKGNPVANATKIWLSSTGGTIVCNNNSKIPQHELNNMLKIISDQFFLICQKWCEHFGNDALKFYC